MSATMIGACVLIYGYSALSPAVPLYRMPIAVTVIAETRTQWIAKTVDGWTVWIPKEKRLTFCQQQEKP